MIQPITMQPITMTDSVGDQYKKKLEQEVFAIKDSLNADAVKTLGLVESEHQINEEPVQAVEKEVVNSNISNNATSQGNPTAITNDTTNKTKEEVAPVQTTLPSNVKVTNTQEVPEVKHTQSNLTYLTEDKYKGTRYTQYDDIIVEMAEKYGVDPNLVKKVVKTESDFNPKTVSRAGAMGLMQLMPDNVKEQGVKDPFNPRQNIEGGVKELKGYIKKYNGDLVLSLAAYNAGAGNVRKYGGVPPFKETQNYIKKILDIDVTKK
ncbi:lytic transglycosylase domain-containing protein [Bacillus luti]|nr:murein transglycosylase [Bacillus cereus]